MVSLLVTAKTWRAVSFRSCFVLGGSRSSKDGADSLACIMESIVCVLRVLTILADIILVVIMLLGTLVLLILVGIG